MHAYVSVYCEKCDRILVAQTDADCFIHYCDCGGMCIFRGIDDHFIWSTQRSPTNKPGHNADHFGRPDDWTPVEDGR